MGLTERYWFEYEDVPENYECALEDAVNNSRTNKKEIFNAQKVEIVRCKDCKYWDKGHTEECSNLDSLCYHTGWCKPDWYCAAGERR